LPNHLRNEADESLPIIRLGQMRLGDFCLVAARFPVQASGQVLEIDQVDLCAALRTPGFEQLAAYKQDLAGFDSDLRSFDLLHLASNRFAPLRPLV